MRVSFHSHHVTGDFSGGKLLVDVTAENEERRVTQARRIFFSVPPDYHVHNDLVAAALMAIMGWGFREAHFNFPISTRCAGLLPLYHRLEEVSPINPDLEPRRPGRHLGITFSGGCDSTTVWTMLRELAGAEFKVITAEYEGYYREAIGYASYHRDVSCWTNFRWVVGDRGRRFDAAIPLLFADYADLHSFATGHTFSGLPHVWHDPRAGGPYEFTPQEAASAAGGLHEVHLLRSLPPSATLRLLVALAPERVERAFIAAARPGNLKHLDKGVMLRHAFQQLGLPVPDYLMHLSFPTDPLTRAHLDRIVYLWTIWHWKFLDRETALRISPHIAAHDFSELDGLSLDLFKRYLPPLAELIPEDLREPLVAGFQAAGIAPFEERDYAELEHLRQFILRVNRSGVLTYE